MSARTRQIFDAMAPILMYGVPALIGGYLLVDFGYRRGLKRSNRVQGSCSSPILRAGVAMLHANYRKAMAIAVENGGPDVTTCIPKSSGEGIEDVLYKYAVFPRYSKDDSSEIAAYWIAAAKVSVSEDGRMSPEIMALEVADVPSAESALESFFTEGGQWQLSSTSGGVQL